jgi:hypothetical protein
MRSSGRTQESSEPQALLEAEAEMAPSMQLLAARKPEATLPRSMARLFLAAFAGVSLLLAAQVFAVDYGIDPYGHFTETHDNYPYEPSDGSRSPAYMLNRSLFKLVHLDKFMAAAAARGEAVQLVVGDSLGKQVDPTILAAATGAPWFNLAFGGANLDENRLLIEHLIERNGQNGERIERIVWNFPFTRIRLNPKDEVTRALAVKDRPIAHLFTFESLRATAYVLRKRWFGIDVTDPVRDLPVDELVAYNIRRFQVDTEGMAWPGDMLERIAAVTERAREAGIEVVFLLVPVHPELQAVFERDFADRYARYRAFLAGYCVVDLTPNAASLWPAPLFRDDIHLADEHLPTLTRAVLHALDRGCPAD